MNNLTMCRRCRQGQMDSVERIELFHPPTGRAVEVRLLGARCNHCGKETVLASQVEENLRRRAARQAYYGEYLLGENIFEFRRKWRLTQQDFSKIFGKGIIAFSRYETEKSYPDLSLTRLLKVAMMHPKVFKELADSAGIEIPFWGSFCASERLIKLHMFSMKMPAKEMCYTHNLEAASENSEIFMQFGEKNVSEAQGDELELLHLEAA